MRLLPFLLLVGCSSKTRPDMSATKLGGDFGALSVWLDETEGLLVERDGQELALIPPDRFQVRSADASYEASLGSFKIEESPATEWISGSKFTEFVAFDDRLQFAVEDASSNTLLRGEVVMHGDQHLSIEVMSENNRIKLGLACDESDHFVGLGSHAMDVDHKGRDVREASRGKVGAPQRRPLTSLHHAGEATTSGCKRGHRHAC